MSTKKEFAVFYAILAAALYAVSSPVSKMLLEDMPPVFMAGFLYLGAGAGMGILGLARRRRGKIEKEMKLSRKELPYAAGMVLLDIAAPVCLMYGLRMSDAASVSLLNNFEIVATALIAWIIFRERISGRLWTAIALVTFASVLLSLEKGGGFRFSWGAALVLAACLSWGLENNCTRMLSVKDPLGVVIVKGLGSGGGSLLIALAAGEKMEQWSCLPVVLLLGFVSYGLSIFFYVWAQKSLGAAKTSTYYAVAPFIGVLFSWGIFGKLPGGRFWAAFAFMLLGTYFAAFEEAPERKYIGKRKREIQEKQRKSE